MCHFVTYQSSVILLRQKFVFDKCGMRLRLSVPGPVYYVQKVSPFCSNNLPPEHGSDVLGGTLDGGGLACPCKITVVALASLPRNRSNRCKSIHLGTAAIAQWFHLRLPSCIFGGSNSNHSIYAFSICIVQIETVIDTGIRKERN